MNSKIALITGGSRGLGRNSALHVSQKGIDVIITYRSNKTEAEAVVKEIEKNGQKAHAFELDVSKSSTFAAFSEELKKVLKEKWNRTDFDFLVNNAGVGLYGSFAETTESNFDELMNTHLKGPFFLTQTLLPLIKNNGGRILNISTGLTRFAFPGYSAYASMKGAMEVLTKYMAKELGSRGIAVNILAPGAIETDFGGGHVRDNADLNKQISSVTALGRVGLPDDIGGMVALLLTEESRWVNAQRIEVSGGMVL